MLQLHHDGQVVGCEWHLRRVGQRRGSCARLRRSVTRARTRSRVAGARPTSGTSGSALARTSRPHRGTRLPAFGSTTCQRMRPPLSQTNGRSRGGRRFRSSGSPGGSELKSPTSTCGPPRHCSIAREQRAPARARVAARSTPRESRSGARRTRAGRARRHEFQERVPRGSRPVPRRRDPGPRGLRTRAIGRAALPMPAGRSRQPPARSPRGRWPPRR